ncbi:MAG: DUF554 domain-containing protein [Clostridia bacterium]
MLGVSVNAGAILLGTLLGLLFGRFLSKDLREKIAQATSLGVVVIGIQMALVTKNILLVIISLVLGVIVGHLLGIENGLNSLGVSIEKQLSQHISTGSFVQAFVTSSLVFCVGAMAILGSLESGLSGNHQILFVKSLLDGVMAMVFASTLGIGVAFSALAVFLYQGAIVILAKFVQPYLSTSVIGELKATGGILILVIGLNLLRVTKIKVGDFLPAILFASIAAYLFLR